MSFYACLASLHPDFLSFNGFFASWLPWLIYVYIHIYTHILLFLAVFLVEAQPLINKLELHQTTIKHLSSIVTGNRNSKQEGSGFPGRDQTLGCLGFGVLLSTMGRTFCVYMCIPTSPTAETCCSSSDVNLLGERLFNIFEIH